MYKYQNFMPTALAYSMLPGLDNNKYFCILISEHPVVKKKCVHILKYSIKYFLKNLEVEMQKLVRMRTTIYCRTLKQPVALHCTQFKLHGLTPCLEVGQNLFKMILDAMESSLHIYLDTHCLSILNSPALIIKTRQALS